MVVKDWPVPKTVKQVKSFLGFAGYTVALYLDSQRLQLLTHGAAHVKRSATVSWSQEFQKSFDNLKTALVNAPSLAYTDFSLPFRLYTDASFDGKGAVLASTQRNKMIRTIVSSSWNGWL